MKYEKNNYETENLYKKIDIGKIEVKNTKSVDAEKFIEHLFEINPRELDSIEEKRQEKAQKFPEILKKPNELRIIFYDTWLSSNKLSREKLNQGIARAENRLARLKNSVNKKYITEKKKQELEIKIGKTENKSAKLRKFFGFPDDAEVYRQRHKYLEKAFREGDIRFEDTLPAHSCIVYGRIKKWEKKQIKLYKDFLEELRSNPEYSIELNTQNRILVEYSKNRGFFCRYNGKEHFLTLGDIFADYVWGVKYMPSDKMSSEIKKELLKNIVKNELRKDIERVRDFGGEYAAGRMLRNPPRSLFGLNLRGSFKLLEGFIFEMLMREFMERVSYLLDEKGFTVKVFRSSLEEDMDDKIDFKVKLFKNNEETKSLIDNKDKNNHIINLGIQVKTNRKGAGTAEKIMKFLNDYKRAVELDAIKMLSLKEFKGSGMERSHILYGKWRDMGCPPGGPEALIPFETQKAIVRKIIEPYITKNDLPDEELEKLLKKEFHQKVALDKTENEKSAKKPTMSINEKTFHSKYLKEHLMGTGISIELIRKCLMDGVEVTDEFKKTGKGARYFKINVPGASLPGRILIPAPEFGEILSSKISNWTAFCEIKTRHGELRPVIKREQLPKWLLDYSSDFYVIVEKNQLLDGRLIMSDEPTENDPEGSWSVVTAHFGPPSFRKPKVPNKKDCSDSRKMEEYFRDCDRSEREKSRVIFIELEQRGPLEKTPSLIGEVRRAGNDIAKTQKGINDLSKRLERLNGKLIKIKQ